MLRVKICGITNPADALLAAGLGAHALGFVFYPKSPRSIRPAEAQAIIRRLPPFVATVGVFVDEDPAAVRAIAAAVGLDWVQLHGSEPPDYCRSLERRVIKGFRMRGPESLAALAHYRDAAQALLLDTYKPGLPGGTGETFDWDLARRARQYGPIILAGGLTADNVVRAIHTAQPAAVDVASGVEAAPGRKDPEKLREFFAAMRKIGEKG